MLARHLILSTLLMVGLCHTAQASHIFDFSSNTPQDFLPNLVRIVATKDIGDEIGGDILVGQDQNRAYIITAAHVIKEASSIELSLYKIKGSSEAVVVAQDDQFDLALLSIPTQKVEGIQILVPADERIIQFEAPVFSIGHPSGGFWKINILNKIQETALYDAEQFFGITPQAIQGGCSGGPVFLKSGAWIGMVTETSMVEGKCLKAAHIKNWLEQLSIPAVHIYTPSFKMQKIAGGQKRFQINQYSLGAFGETYSTIDMDQLDDFYLADREVSVADFEAFVMATNYTTAVEKTGKGVLIYDGEDQMRTPIFMEGGFWYNDAFGKPYQKGKKNFPVVNVSFNDAKAFCDWLSKYTGQTYRLPKGAEMAYAILPATQKALASFKPENVFDAAACDNGITCHLYLSGNLCQGYFTAKEIAGTDPYYNDAFPTLSPCGQFPPSPLGLYDLYGNVSEWCDGYFQSGIPLYVGANWAQTKWEHCVEYSNEHQKKDTVAISDFHYNSEYHSDYAITNSLGSYLNYGFYSIIRYPEEDGSYYSHNSHGNVYGFRLEYSSYENGIDEKYADVNWEYQFENKLFRGTNFIGFRVAMDNE